MMKKFLVSLFVLSGFVLYSFSQKVIGSDSMPAIVPVVSNNGNNQTIDSTTISTPLPPTPQTTNSGSSVTTTQTTNPSLISGFKDGQYTGDSADAFYGNVQVKAVISGGKITDVQFLDYPHDRQRSQDINSQATPMLKTEAIQVQSANVDIISGATATSQAFIQSLGSALAKAK